ncbi:MAG: alpha/beta hydrolase [Dehalococcoidia bacterium]|nr:MAG: alpha/beta hydrolase [Dehalococcoidia bacterium]
MPVQHINGADLYFERAGQGVSALFIHGMCGNANVWDTQVQHLSDRLTCITYDRRGHTRSSLGDVAQRTVELHADDAASLIRALDLAPCLLVASSGGARIGVDLVRRYPDLVRAAVLSEPPIFGLDPEHGGAGIMADLQPSVGAALRANDPRGAVDAFFTYMCPGLWAQLDARGKEPYRANHVELMGDLEMPPYSITVDDLRRIQTPTTIVTGSTSHPVLRRVARTVADAMPHARLAEIAGVGHVTYAEAPEAFAALVRERAEA